MIQIEQEGGDSLKRTEHSIEVGKRMKSLRGDRPKTCVARALGIAYSAYCFYESGDRDPRDETKKKIASYYGVPVEFIFST